MDHVRLEPVHKIRIRAGGAEIVDTSRGVIVHEGGLPERYYVPREDVRGEIVAGTGAGTCPWKGEWRHVDLVVGDKRIANAGWTYGEPTPACASIRDFIAFYPDKLERLEVYKVAEPR